MTRSKASTTTRGQGTGKQAVSVDSVVESTITAHRLLAPQDRVLVAFSGGADSTALVLVLRRLGYRVVLGHVDHGMRSDSAADAESCRQVAAELALPIQVDTVRVSPPTEAEARRVRYQALERMARLVRADKIATGHTRDDNVETVLMRLERGGRGFPIPPQRGTIVRPLLDIRRKDTEAVCRQNRMRFLTDPTNFNERFTRNRIRRRVVPGLSAEEIDRLIAEAESNRARAGATLAEVAGAEARRGLIHDQSGAAVSRRWLNEAPPVVRRAAFRRAMELLGIEPGERLVGDVDAKIRPRTGARLNLPGGWMVWSEPGEVVFGRIEAPTALPAVPILVPGSTPVPEWSIEVRTALRARGYRDGSPSTATCDGSEMGLRPAEAVVDADLFSEDPHREGLLLRAWEHGDRFHPLGAPGTKKLQDFFVDARVPRRMRDRIPILLSEDRIVWVAGLRIDERFKITAGTKRILQIEIFPFF